MSKQNNLEESLSAFMDNEASEFEYRRLLKEAAVNGALKSKWERYHLISSAIKEQSCLDHPVDLLSGIHKELQNDTYQFNSPRQNINTEKVEKSSGGWFKTVAQGAVAASVAVAVLYTATFVSTTPNSDSTMRELADNTTQDAALPSFNGTYTPTEFSQVVSYDNLDEVAANRLRQAVYQEFGANADQAVEIPVNFNLQNRERER